MAVLLPYDADSGSLYQYGTMALIFIGILEES
jgi:hypothetical protein